jgi:hypothetical protein
MKQSYFTAVFSLRRVSKVTKKIVDVAFGFYVIKDAGVTGDIM